MKTIFLAFTKYWIQFWSRLCNFKLKFNTMLLFSNFKSNITLPASALSAPLNLASAKPFRQTIEALNRPLAKQLKKLLIQNLKKKPF